MVNKLINVFKKLRVRYYNMGPGSDKEKRQDLEQFHAEGFDLLGLSEHADHADVTADFIHDHPEYDRFFNPHDPGGSKECLIYRKSLGVVTLKKSTQLTKAMHLPGGAGPEDATPKWLHRIRIRVRVSEKRTRRVHFMVGHQYASVGSRREAAKMFVRAVADVLRRLSGVLILVADQNTTPSSALLQALKVLLPNWSSKTSGDTMQHRVIDYIMVRGAKIVEAWTQKKSSDHKAVYADVQL